MAHEFVITPLQLWEIMLLICGAIITIGGAIKVVKGWLTDANKPKKEIKTEIESIEGTLENHSKFFENDKKAIYELKRGQHIMYKSQLALISHAIDGNNTKELKEVKSELINELLNTN